MPCVIMSIVHQKLHHAASHHGAEKKGTRSGGIPTLVLRPSGHLLAAPLRVDSPNE